MDCVVSLFGYVRRESEAYDLFQLAMQGRCSLVPTRLNEKQRQFVAPGQVYIYDERASKIQRWTDGETWSDSCNYGEFQVYREMESTVKNGNRVKLEKPQGMRKKTIFDRRFNTHLRLVCYYNERMEQLLGKIEKLPFFPYRPGSLIVTEQMLINYATIPQTIPPQLEFLIATSSPTPPVSNSSKSHSARNAKRTTSSAGHFKLGNKTPLSPLSDTYTTTDDSPHSGTDSPHEDINFENFAMSSSLESEVSFKVFEGDRSTTELIPFEPSSTLNSDNLVFKLEDFTTHPTNLLQMDSSFLPHTQHPIAIHPSTVLGPVARSNDRSSVVDPNVFPSPALKRSRSEANTAGSGSVSMHHRPPPLPASNASPSPPLILKVPNVNAPFLQVQYPGGSSFVSLSDTGDLLVSSQGENADFAELVEAQPDQVSLMVPASVVNMQSGIATAEFDTEIVIPRIVSSSPLIVGRKGRPEDSDKSMVQIALVGQVPVLIKGTANKGDFIVAGRDFGDVRAVKEHLMQLDIFGRVCGIALEDSKPTDNNENSIVNVLIFYPDVNFLTRDLEKFKMNMQGTLNSVHIDLKKLQDMFAETRHKVIHVEQQQQQLESTLQSATTELAVIKRQNATISEKQNELYSQTNYLTSLLDSKPKPKALSKRVRNILIFFVILILTSTCIALATALGIVLTKTTPTMSTLAQIPEPTNIPSDLVVMFRYDPQYALPNQLSINVRLFNNGSYNNLDLRSVSVRFYFTTPTIPSNGNLDCELISSDPISNSLVELVIVATGPLQKSNHYIQFAFPGTSDAIAPGQSEIVSAFCRVLPTLPNFNYAEQYSYTNSSTWVEVQNLPVYVGNTLDLGFEPTSVQTSKQR